MRQTMSLASRRDLIRATYERYQKSSSLAKKQILDEFVAATSYHRKYALELLLHPPRMKPAKAKRKRRPRYGAPVRQALTNLWKTSNCICAKRLMPFLPCLIEAMERHGELDLGPGVRAALLRMSAATADRLLQPERRSLKPRGRCTTKPGTLLRRQIPVRTFADWNEKEPGFLEIDLVAHCDDNASGEFLHSLVMTDVDTGWTEYVALRNKGQECVVTGIEQARQRFPFTVMGIDSDNGSEFINGHLARYCKQEQITFTRCRPYHKNDQCHVEQKNWSIVRRMVGYDRYEGERAHEALESLYQTLRLYQNYFQPSMKLLSKERVSSTNGTSITGSRVRKQYEEAKTPYQRVLESEQIGKEIKEQLRVEYQKLNPRELHQQVEMLQRKTWEQAHVYRRTKTEEVKTEGPRAAAATVG